MVICPLCEHQQEFGFECEQCGKDLGGLAALGPPPVREEVIEGLEATLEARVGEVPIDRVGDLELSRFEAVEVPVEVTPDFETSALPSVGEVAVERLGDMTEDRAVDDGVRTALPQGAVECRRCRAPNQLGAICENCGFKILRGAWSAQPTHLRVQEVSTRCRACGAPAKAGQKCTDCGHDVPFPDA